MASYIDVHVLQDLPPANINRDDNGTPKTARYGGVERLRVSSQAWKRATRKLFEESLPREDLGVRTRRLVELLSKSLIERGMAEDAAASTSKEVLETLKLKIEKKKIKSENKSKSGDEDSFEQTQYLVFAGRTQIDQLADALVNPGATPKSVDAPGILRSDHPLDVALFGRMIADMTDLKVDGSVQVAHAISTHAAQTQFDYFTAVDDEQGDDEAGAGMIGTVEFSSGTLYRYATVGLQQLADNMGDLDAAINGVRVFIDSFVRSMPSGKQNSFAALTRPALVLIVIRDDRPVNLVSAFEKPIRGGSHAGYMEDSLKQLAKMYERETARWGDTPRLVIASYFGSESAEDALAAQFGESQDLPSLLAAVDARLRESRTHE